MKDLVLDFDGVLHSYTSGWQGATTISDPPVEGAIEFIIRSLPDFRISISSSRSCKWGGRRAMKKWLKKNLIEWIDEVTLHSNLELCQVAGIDPFHFSDDDFERWADSVMDQIQWPFVKPPAFLTIDDRAWTFRGTWPSVEEMKAFKPWNVK